MRELLDQIGTVQSSAVSATTGQFTITHANAETSAQMRLLPLSQSGMLTHLGSNLPTETFQLWIDAQVTVHPGYMVTLNSVTYEIISVETYGVFESPDYHKCLAQRMLST